MVYSQPHISIELVTNDLLLVTVDDYELCDYIEDYLIEDCDFDFLSYTVRENGKHQMRLDNSRSFHELKTAIQRLDKVEIERIYKLNN